MCLHYVTIIPLGRGTCLSKSHSPRMLCAKFGRNWPNGLEKKIFKSLMYFCYFVIISPFSKCTLTLNPFYLRMFCAYSLVKSGQVGLEVGILKCCQYIFHYFAIISAFKCIKIWAWIPFVPMFDMHLYDRFLITARVPKCFSRQWFLIHIQALDF